MYRPARDGAIVRLVTSAWPVVTSRWVPPALLAAIGLDDALLMPHAPSYAVLGVFDEPAHFATSMLLLGGIASGLRRWGRRPRAGFAVGLLLAGNLIDLDHLPAILGSLVLTHGTSRPYTHSMTTVVALLMLAAAARVRRRGVAFVALGAAVGVSGHLLRDLATSPVSLLWPASDAGLTIPHPAYLSILALAAVITMVPPSRQEAADLGGELNRTRLTADSHPD
jgi:inner membrane protein